MSKIDSTKKSALLATNGQTKGSLSGTQCAAGGYARKYASGDVDGFVATAAVEGVGGSGVAGEKSGGASRCDTTMAGVEGAESASSVVAP